jgi:hypothetical protein
VRCGDHVSRAGPKRDRRKDPFNEKDCRGIEADG